MCTSLICDYELNVGGGGGGGGGRLLNEMAAVVHPAAHF